MKGGFTATERISQALVADSESEPGGTTLANDVEART